MRITFYSCYMNHHQLPIALELYKMFGDDYHFVAQYPFNQERLKLGYVDMNKQYPFIVRMYENEQENQRALELAASSDVIIHDTSFLDVEKIAITNGRLVFRYSEHVLKKGIKQILNPNSILQMFRGHFCRNSKENNNVNMLCASAYKGLEAKLYNEYPHRIYKWGYFPELYCYTKQELFAKKGNERIEILWCGRFLEWKNVDWTIDIAKYLKKREVVFKITLIGEGQEKDKIIKLVKEEQLSEYVEILPGVNYKEMREYMERANIYLFLSNHAEGWGVVLNEAMNSGCAVIANKAAGSVPYLVRNNYNGYVFRNSERKKLRKYVYNLCVDSQKREQMGWNAYQTILREWSPRIAAENLVQLSRRIIENKKIDIETGPGSKA